MRSLTLFAVLVLTPTVAHATDTWSDPKPGVRRLHRVTTNQDINVLDIDLCAAGVSVRATKTTERQQTVPSFGAAVGADAAINGDFFTPAFSTDGPAVGDGGAWGGTDHTYVAPVQFGLHRIALPPHNDTAGVGAWALQVVSGHPTLLVNGVAFPGNNGDSVCTARNPRTSVGFTADKRHLIMAVVDGRATTRIGMTCDELTALMKELGATDAVNLDGGGSSTMWLTGTVLNHPSDGTPRVVGNHLAVHATGSGAAPNCPKPAFDAASVAVDAPTAMTSGDEVSVSMQLTNEGYTAWDMAKTHVGTQGPQDRPSPFYQATTWPAPNRAVAADQAYAPGATAHFTWTMVAPEVTVPTTFDESFQLVQEGVAWFGPPQTMHITVTPRSGTMPDGGSGGDGGGGGGGGGCSTSSGGSSASWVLVLLAAICASGGRRCTRACRARRRCDAGLRTPS